MINEVYGGHNLTRGHNYTVTVTFNNTYNAMITMRVFAQFYFEGGSSNGIGKPLNMSPYNHIYTVYSQYPYGNDTITFAAGEIKNFSNSWVIPNVESYALTNVRQSTWWYNVNDISQLASGYYPMVGSESYPWLSFKTIDPRIDMIKQNGRYTPIFNITQELYVENYKYSQNVNQDDYELEIRLYNNSYLNSTGLVHTQTASLPSSLAKGSVTPFVFIIPIHQNWTGNRFYVQMLSKMLKSIEPHPSFQGKYIAIQGGAPYFRPGDIAYQYDDTLRFGPDSKIDSEKITIFNPTFYNNQLNLNMSNLTARNFSVSWDGINFGNESVNISLYPLQSRELNFWVRADYEPWPTVEQEELMTISATSKLRTSVNRIEEKYIELDYFLAVEPNRFDWFNLNPQDFFVVNPTGQDKQTVFLETVNTTKDREVGVRWTVEGNEIQLGLMNGKEYWVNISLINATTREVLRTNVQKFVVDINGQNEISVTHNFTQGRYLLTMSLDRDNNLTETDSTLVPAEDENYAEYEIPIVITNCYYNLNDGYMHYVDYYFGDVIDTENRCECPGDLIMIFGTGFCADPFGDGCDVYDLAECNNWTKTIPLACGWECDGTSCPPTSITPGDCLSCMNITNTCGGYNNNESCITDPCQKASLFDCTFLNCDGTKKFGCYWEDNRCKFNGTIEEPPFSRTCNYTIDIVQRCEGDAEKQVIKYVTFNPGCSNKTRENLCGTEIAALPFFTWTNFLVSIVIIAVVYAVFRINRKRRASKKIKHKKHS